MIRCLALIVLLPLTISAARAGDAPAKWGDWHKWGDQGDGTYRNPVLRDITRTEAYFVKPAAGHAYKIESPLDGKTWTLYGGHADVVLRSPHVDKKPVRVRYLWLTNPKGEPALWEFRVY